MKKLIYCLLFAGFCLLYSCSLILNGSKFSRTSDDFIQHLVQGDYNRCISLLYADSPQDLTNNEDMLKAKLADMRNAIVDTFGTPLSSKVIELQKRFSTEKAGGTPAGTTEVEIEINNGKRLGALHGLFDDKTGKIITLDIIPVNLPVPSLLPFMLMSLAALAVLIFIACMIISIYRSNTPRKWFKYLCVFFLNIPVIGYSVANGYFIHFFNFKYILFAGIEWMKLGYLGSEVSFGIPLGGLYVLYTLLRGKLGLKTIS